MQLFLLHSKEQIFIFQSQKLILTAASREANCHRYSNPSFHHLIQLDHRFHHNISFAFPFSRNSRCYFWTKNEIEKKKKMNRWKWWFLVWKLVSCQSCHLESFCCCFNFLSKKRGSEAAFATNHTLAANLLFNFRFKRKELCVRKTTGDDLMLKGVIWATFILIWLHFFALNEEWNHAKSVLCQIHKVKVG